jgi:hypothetical protein
VQRSITETTRMRFESLVVGDCHGKLVAEEELEVGLWRLIVVRRFRHSGTVFIPLPM